MFYSISTRSFRDVFEKEGEAALAALTALSKSSFVPKLIVPMTSSVAGLMAFYFSL